MPTGVRCIMVVAGLTLSLDVGDARDDSAGILRARSDVRQQQSRLEAAGQYKRDSGECRSVERRVPAPPLLRRTTDGKYGYVTNSGQSVKFDAAGSGAARYRTALRICRTDVGALPVAAGRVSQLHNVRPWCPRRSTASTALMCGIHSLSPNAAEQSDNRPPARVVTIDTSTNCAGAPLLACPCHYTSRRRGGSG